MNTDAFIAGYAAENPASLDKVASDPIFDIRKLFPMHDIPEEERLKRIIARRKKSQKDARQGMRRGTAATSERTPDQIRDSLRRQQGRKSLGDKKRQIPYHSIEI